MVLRRQVDDRQLDSRFATAVRDVRISTHFGLTLCIRSAPTFSSFPQKLRGWYYISLGEQEPITVRNQDERS